MFSGKEILSCLTPFALYPESRFHGPAHWARVNHFGQELARLNGLPLDAKQCVSVFAWVHDLARTDDGGGNQHAIEGASYFDVVRPVVFPNLKKNQVEIVQTAIFFHSDGMPAESAYYRGLFDHLDGDENEIITTVGCCWDADRLDLIRLGIQPQAQSMSTEYWERVLPLAETLHKRKDV